MRNLKSPHSLGYAIKSAIACMALNLGFAYCADTPDIRGFITGIADYDQRDPYASIMVEGKKEADTKVDKASLRISLKTKFFKMENHQRVEAKYSDLNMGQQIEVQFDGPVAESYPVQGTAGEIVIIAQAPTCETPLQDLIEIKEGNIVTLYGNLQDGIMGIGGETTGWLLTYENSKGKMSIEVDMSDIAKPIKGSVLILGKVIKKDYVERGPTLILKATSVEKSDYQPGMKIQTKKP